MGESAIRGEYSRQKCRLRCSGALLPYLYMLLRPFQCEGAIGGGVCEC